MVLFIYLFLFLLLSQRAEPYYRLYIFGTLHRGPVPLPSELLDASWTARPRRSLPPRPNLSPVVYKHILVQPSTERSELSCLFGLLLHDESTFVPECLNKGLV
jgi:hypothetical protein